MKAKIMKNRRGIKVVYISSPMRVTTSAARFRDLVQQLTGPDSTVAADMANSAFSFVDVVDYSGAVHGRPPPPLDPSSNLVVGQPMLSSDQMWRSEMAPAPAPAVEEEDQNPLHLDDVYYGFPSQWIFG